MFRDQRAGLTAALGGAAVAALIFFANSAAVKPIRNTTVRLFFPYLESAGELGRWIFNMRERVPEGSAEEMALKFKIQVLRRENEELERALGFKEARGLNLRGVRVMFFSRAGGREFFLIDQGAGAGIKAGDLAVDSYGMLLGVVKESENGFAKVEVASNADLTFEVQILPVGVKALARGLGGRAFAVELLPQNAPVRRGDFVALSGAGRGAIFLGEIIMVTARETAAFREARAVLLGSPERLGEVFFIIQ